jgi:hypothetical protein
MGGNSDAHRRLRSHRRNNKPWRRNRPICLTLASRSQPVKMVHRRVRPRPRPPWGVAQKRSHLEPSLGSQSLELLPLDSSARVSFSSVETRKFCRECGKILSRTCHRTQCMDLVCWDHTRLTRWATTTPMLLCHPTACRCPRAHLQSNSLPHNRTRSSILACRATRPRTTTPDGRWSHRLPSSTERYTPNWTPHITHRAPTCGILRSLPRIGFDDLSWYIVFFKRESFPTGYGEWVLKFTIGGIERNEWVISLTMLQRHFYVIGS